ncbi:MAG: TonB-dependent receptor, partial [Acidobacteriota bacterium]
MGIRKLFKILLIIFFIHATLSTEIVEKIEVSSKALFEKMVSKNMIVIDKEFINKFGIQKISDIFRFIPGVHISRRGNGDTSYDISMRGGNFEQVQILINGIPFNNPQTGHFNTDLPISVENIERIEIARGSSSVSHGPGGSAGKINIILKEYQGIMVNLTGGDKSLAGAGLGFGEKFGNIKFEVNADTISSKGYYDGQEYNNQQLSSTLSYRSAMTSFIFNAGYLTKQFGAKDFYAPFPSKEKIDTGNFNFNYKMSGKIEHEFNFSMIIHNDDFVLDRYDKDFFRSGSKTLRKYIKYQNYFSIGDLAFSTGADLDHLQIKSSVIGEHSRKRGGLFFNTGIKKDNWGIDVGVRWNVENNISPKTSFYSGIYTVFKHNIILRGSYAVSLRYPTFTELYYKSPANIGNEELYPEKSENFEVSLDLPLKYFKAGLNLFARKQYQMIDWIKEDYRSPWRAVNSDDNDV